MVSTAMQGGCTCENASYLRTGTGNVEIAALIAPRPLGMTAAADWTKEIATKGLPELKQHYKMLGVPSLVMARPLVQFPHNYNYVSRAVMYGWMNKHLKLGLPEPIVEEDFQPLSIAEMSVWDASHPRPPSGDAYERSLLKWITADSRRQMESLVPHDGPSLTEFRKVLGGAIDVLIGRRLPPAGAISVSAGQKTAALGDWPIQTMLLRNSVQHEELPLAVLRPRAWNGAAAVVWVSREGKQSLLDESGHPRPAIARLIEAGRAVIGLDLMGQGEFTPDGKPLARARLNSSGRDHWAQYAGFTFGYNYPLFAQRVHDILSAVSYAHDGLSAKRVSVVGLGGAGHWVAAARAQAGAAIDRAVVDTGGFRFARLTAIDDPDFLPGGAKYLDLPGILALSAPQPLWLAGEGRTPPPVVAAAYQAAGQGENLTCFSGQPDKQPSAAIAWLLQSGP
jgi:hypothetical protein